MRQAQGKTITILNAQAGNKAAPSGAGNLMSQFTGILRTAKHLLTIVITGGPADVIFWGRDNNKQIWGVHRGAAYLGLAIGTYHVIIENLGGYSAIDVEVANAVGATTTVHLSEMLENNMTRGD